MISIIIPTFNRAHVILETIDSIKKQSYANWECIIVDDGSTDNTLSLLEEELKDDDRFVITTRPTDRKKGPSACRNYGFSISKGDFIQFFDSDDIMHPNHLLYKIENSGDVDFVVCKLKEFKDCFDDKLFLIDNTEPIVKEKDVFTAFVTGRFPMMMVAPLWKRSILEKYLPIREDLHILEDHELYARILKENKKYEIVNKVLILIRTGSDSLTNNFYNKVSSGIDSFLEAKKTVLFLKREDSIINHSIVKMVLGCFRLALAEQDYKNAEKCLLFIRKFNTNKALTFRLNLISIHFFYYLFKFLKRGDTRFKFLLKIGR